MGSRINKAMEVYSNFNKTDKVNNGSPDIEKVVWWN